MSRRLGRAPLQAADDVALAVADQRRGDPVDPAQIERVDAGDDPSRDLRDEDVGIAAEVPGSRRWTASSPGHSASSSTVTATSAPACARRTRAARIALRMLGSPPRRCSAVEQRRRVGESRRARGSLGTCPRNCRWNARVVVERRAARGARAREVATDACLTAGRPRRLIVARSGRRAPLGLGKRESPRRGTARALGYLRSSLFRVPQPRQVQVAGSAAMYSCPRVKRTCRRPERITPSSRRKEAAPFAGIGRTATVRYQTRLRRHCIVVSRQSPL